MTSSMSSRATRSPSTRCSRSRRLVRRNSLRPAHHLEAVVEVDLQELLEPQGERLPVDQRHVIDAEGLLHRRQLVELLQHGLRHEAVLDLDHQPEPVRPVGEVLDVRDALELLRGDEVLDLGDHLLRADGEGQFGDDEALAARRDVLYRDGRTDLERAAACRVRVLDPAETDDPATGRQVGARDETHQGLEVGVRVPDEMARGGDHLAEVVRGHVGRHADRDPGRPVDQEVRVRRRQDDGLLLLAVVVRLVVDGVLVDRLRHQRRGVGHPALGVPHGGRRVVVAERAEVAVSVDEGQAHRERLCHAHQCVIDRRVTVRVQLAHHFADDTGALHVAAVGAQPHLVHLGHDAAVHGLHAVAGVGQSPGVDHRVRVLEEGALHFVDDVDVEDLLLEVVRRRGLRAAAGHRGCDSFTDSVGQPQVLTPTIVDRRTDNADLDPSEVVSGAPQEPLFTAPSTTTFTDRELRQVPVRLLTVAGPAGNPVSRSKGRTCPWVTRPQPRPVPAA